jgi:hypothetical protein
MKRRMLLGTLVLLLAASCSMGQSGSSQPAPADRARVTGVWRAEMDGLPAISMVLTEEGGGLSGAVLFYLHTRKTENEEYTSTPGLPEPILNVSADGDTLHFDVSHRRAHPPGSLNDRPMRFVLRLTGPNQAELVNESEPGGPRVMLTRSEF